MDYHGMDVRNLPNLPPVPQAPDRVVVGSQQLLNNDPAATGIINLDTAAEDPATALLNEAAKKAGCTVDELKNKSFTLEKGFRPEKDSKDTSIPIHSYSNPPGPDCYYFVRHWRVTVNDAQGKPMQLHFTKKIYTNVEVPRNMDPVAHKQQQYIAALAARTYANVEEARMLKTGANIENELYKSIGVHISKIAHDRFVTLEMFHNAKSVTINKQKDIKDATVDSVRLRFRASKKEGENENEGFHNIILAPVAFTLKEKPYRFMAGDSPSAHVRKVAAALNTEDAFAKIRDDVEAKKAFADVGLNLAEVKAFKEGETKAAVQNFYKEQAYFGDRDAVKALMANRGKGYELSAGMINKIAAEKSIVDKIRNKKPEDLAALKNLEKLLKNNPSDAEKAEGRKILEAVKVAHANMVKEDATIAKLESELVLMGEVANAANIAERKKSLDDIKKLIDDMEQLVPPEPLQPPVPKPGNNPPVNHRTNFNTDDQPPFAPLDNII